jgi:hypothetical protein
MDVDELTMLQTRESPKSFDSATTLSVDSDEDCKSEPQDPLGSGEELL